MTRVRTCALLTGLLCSAAITAPASAHHSIQAQFDIRKTLTVTGSVWRIEFVNPHSYLTVNVTDADGKVTRWAFEMGAATQLRQQGLSRSDRGGLKPGDQVTVTALAARDGSNSGLLQELTMPDGRVLKFRPNPGEL